MKIVNQFKINEDNTIEILVPHLNNKFNYYYEPYEKLHKFDQATVKLKQGDKGFILKVDAAQEVIEVLKNSLKNAVNNQMPLVNNIVVGQLGYLYNINTYQEDLDSVNFSEFWLWSIRGIQTWLYNKDNKIYLEISPSYPWLYEEPVEGEKYVSFDMFLKTYNPILITEIDKSVAIKLIKECEDILDQLDRDHAKLLQKLSK